MNFWKLSHVCWAGIGAAAAAIAVIALAASPAEARRTGQDPWCAQFSDDASLDCSYRTFQQCLATIWGVGGNCLVNPRYEFSAAPEEPIRPPRYRRR